MRFTKAIVRLPGKNFSQGLTLSASPGGPDLRKALEQHAAYCRALAACGVEVTVMKADENHPDGTFVEDTFVITEKVAIATRPGAMTRMGEVESVSEVLGGFRPAFERIEAPGTVDGGDVCQVDEHFLIGVSARTNEAGAAQLARILARHGYSSARIDIRRHASLLHLKSGIAYLGERSFLIAPGFPTEALTDCDTIEVAAGETYAANAVRVNDVLFIAAGFAQVSGILDKRGYRVCPLEMSEFAKMDGGLSCLSLRF